MEDVELVQEMHTELVDALRLTAAPGGDRVARWLDALPRYRVGHLQRLRGIEWPLGRDLADVELMGAAYRGLGITTCIAQGRAAARRTMSRAGSREGITAAPPPSGRGTNTETVPGPAPEGAEDQEPPGPETAEAPAVTTSWPTQPTGRSEPPGGEEDAGRGDQGDAGSGAPPG